VGGVTVQRMLQGGTLYYENFGENRAGKAVYAFGCYDCY
jgi:hypothetical protein